MKTSLETRLGIALTSSQRSAAEAFVERLAGSLARAPLPAAVSLADGSWASALLADVVVFAWIDDRYDADGRCAPGPLELRRVLAQLEQELEPDARSPAALALWRRTADEFVGLMDARANAGPDRRWTLLEYAQEAVVDSSIHHLLATLSLVFELDLHARLDEPELAAFVGELGLRARLLNDLHSCERERGDAAPRNLVLELEARAGPDGARGIVADMAADTHHGLLRLRERLGPTDPLAELGWRTLEVIESIYADVSARYAPLGARSGLRA